MKIRHHTYHRCASCGCLKRFEFFTAAQKNMIRNKAPGHCSACLRKNIGKRCVVCEGMSHRRDPEGCYGCGQPYQAENYRTTTLSSGNFVYPEGGPVGRC